MRVVIVFVVMREMHVELHAFDGGFVLARDVKVVAVDLEFGEFAFEFARVHAQINQRADEHVASDATEDVEVKCFHLCCRKENIEHPTSNIERRTGWLPKQFDVRCSMFSVRCWFSKIIFLPMI